MVVTDKVQAPIVTTKRLLAFASSRHNIDVSHSTAAVGAQGQRGVDGRERFCPCIRHRREGHIGNPVEAVRQGVGKAANELLGIKCHHLGFAILPIVLQDRAIG